MTCTYRGHGAILGMGAPLDRTMAEILGKAEGLCRGKGGSMHLTDVSVGALGSFAVVGAHLPFATGAALAAQYLGTDAVTLTFFGDGTTNIGAFHEALNLAAIWKLPVVFVCENNLYGEYSPLRSTTSVDDIAERAAANGLPGSIVDGQEIDAVHDAVGAAVERARRGEGPSLLEMKTYRFRGHSRTDPAKYRPEGELEKWKERDPIKVYRERLKQFGIGDDVIAKIDADVKRVVDEATEACKAAPNPPMEILFTDVYADGGWAWRN